MAEITTMVMVTNTATMDTLIITMGTGAILRRDILITIMGMAEITTMVTERNTIMGMELTQRKVTWITMTSIRRKATTMVATRPRRRSFSKEEKTGGRTK